ncbi:RNA-binding motif protein 25 isoform X1 [Humulus lupulus]|uniref:RNA-binding motif protein 25 isoform X1 n=2 Tax=Humulus lupulus TaxID=3486 RepID=UPI002B40F7FA|nr:RNA-binding motif protein 25 isoform X1 [Humulus lupulus]
MADASSSPANLESNPLNENPTTATQQTQSNPVVASAQPPQLPPPPLQSSQPTPSPSIPVAASLNSNPTLVPPPPPPSVSYAVPSVAGVPAVQPSAPSFRPVPHFTPVPNPNYQNHIIQNPGVQPPGVGSVPMAPGAATGGPGAMAIPMQQPLMPYQLAPGQPLNPAMRPPYAPMPNGYAAMPGLSRYPSPYQTMVRPFRPPGAIGMGVLSRPPIPGIPGVRPIIPPIVRPAIVPSVTPAEKPQTTVYVGKIAPTVENDFILALLQVCGAVKSWKRGQVPTNGTPRGFGFCEFEAAEGVLRALRLLSKFNIDGQELVLNVNQATKDYLTRYVEKKAENSKKVKETDAEATAKEGEGVVGDEKNNDLPTPAAEEPKEDNDSVNKENDNATFGIVTDEDKEADQVASKKLRSMIEERMKNKPLPPPPAQAPSDVIGNSNSELPAKSRDGDSEADKNDAVDEKNDDELTSDNKQVSENDRLDISSPDKNRRNDRRSRERDRDRDLRRDKEREIVRYERETERERIRKEREQRRKIEEAERQYEEYLKEWEYREREKEKQRQYEKDREKERERKRKKEIIYEEEDEDDDSRKRWRRSVLEEKRKRRLREKEDDLADRLKEEQEIAEAKRRAEEEKLQQEQKDVLKSSLDHSTNGAEEAMLVEESNTELKDKAMEEDSEADSSRENYIGETNLQNGSTSDESTMAPPSAAIDMQQNGNVTTKKLGFGLVGSGKRTTVPSVFKEDDDDDAHKDKKMRPLVPIDYSTEELQVAQPTVSGTTQSHLVAAAEFAKRISNVGPKEEKPDTEKERKRTRERNDEDVIRSKNETKEKTHDTDREHGIDKVKSTDNKKLLDAKQLIDMIPRTKEELFSYEINWAIYEKHALHERMRPWISKKITEFLGEEETTLVDYIVSSTQDHVEADRMLQLLQSILDEEAEMFVLKMWRMLIFEIKKVETGLSTSRSRT